MISKYEFIDAMKALFPVTLMCAWAGVSRSGFYDWARRAPSAAAVRRGELELVVAALFAAADGTYGHRRVHAELARAGIAAGVELVRTIMRDLGLYPCQKRPFRPTTTIPGAALDTPDLLGRDFTADAPGTKLVGDITYVPTTQGFAYLATVIDCHTKECIGWAIADHMRADLVCDALSRAARTYSLEPDCVFHSDRGTQYLSEKFIRHADILGVRRSVGRTGSCFDNALAESFNSAVKVERVHRMRYRSIAEATTDVARYIEFRYNRRRLHSAIEYRTPREAYENYINNHARPKAA